MASTSSPSPLLLHPTPKQSLFSISPPPNPTLKTPTIRSRLSKLCQEGNPHLARQLFDTIPRPSTVLWNAIIIGYICNNMPLQALHFYSHLITTSPSTIPDSYTYSSTLKACAATSNLLLGKAIHAQFIRCVAYPSRIVYNSLLNTYSSCLNGFDDKYDLVEKVFKSMRKRDVIAWNTMVAWYVKTKRYGAAIRQFRIMMKMDVKPSVVSFVNVFPALSSVGDYENANVVYGLLVKLGSEYRDDLFVVSSAVSMYSELGYVDIARRVFDGCAERNAEVLNTMIGAYVQNSCFLEAVDLFLRAMESEQTVVDHVTFLSALTAVSQLQCLELGQQIHAFLTKSITVVPVTLMNSIVAMYSRCNSINMAFEVFEKMPERDVVSWNTMISGFIQNGLDDEGLMLVYEMQKQKFKIDSVTVLSLLSAASNLRNKEIGRQTHAYLVRNNIQFDGMEGYLIDMYAKSGLIMTAGRVFENSHINNRDLATWNAMIAGYTQNGLVEDASVTFRQMVEQNLRPNAVTLASILPACNPFGNIELGKQLHGFAIRYLLDQNVFVGSALVDMYSKSGEINYAENVFAGSAEKNSVTYTTMISGYGQNGMGDKAINLFHSMQKSGIRPDPVTFVAVLAACSYMGLVDEGLQIFESMKRDFKIQPSTQHYCCVADMLGRVGRVQEAFKFVEQLGEEGNVIEIWGSLLGACRLHGQIELGEVVARKLLEMGSVDRLSGYQVLLSNMYAEEKNWEVVDKLRKEMREKGSRKEVGSSWIDIGGQVIRFVSKDKDHSQSSEICEMLDRLTMEMKDIDHNSVEIDKL
ncbi:Tetratricopeptide repeat (TPR)-like superfamily protein [Euphorbia peplus]|nr:Tetratricopeptide repeat (TPR)-like superfamily protein [Euphorbia peplus]